MVTGRYGTVLFLTCAVLAACKQPSSTADLCFSTRVGMGQNLQTLFCGRDSCYLMVFATNIPRPASVAMFGTAVPRDTLSLGDALVQSFLKEDLPPMSQRTSMTLSIMRNGAGISLPNDPGTDDRISKVKEWMYNRNEEARSHPPLWRDSLVLGSVEGKPKEIAIRLSPKGSRHGSPFGSAMSLRVFHFLAESRGKERVEFPVDSLASLVSGGTLIHRLPASVDSVQAVLKIYSTKDSTRLPHACLEGVFELRSRAIGL